MSSACKDVRDVLVCKCRHGLVQSDALTNVSINNWRLYGAVLCIQIYTSYVQLKPDNNIISSGFRGLHFLQIQLSGVKGMNE
jgi:hypothetical protein